jgi:predicted nucleotide-binding protein (sugar kinase/HSP70/actin superfamily)
MPSQRLPVCVPRVGIVGEIYVKYNAFSNNHVVQWLSEHGLEVVLPGFFEFFDGGLVSQVNAVKTNIRKRDSLWLLSVMGRKLVNHYLHLFDEVMQKYRYYRSPTPIKKLLRWRKKF